MTLSPAVKVGVFVFIGLLAFTIVAAFLTGYRMKMAGYPITVIYSDSQGLTQGSEVRMAGVAIGVVQKPTLDRYQRAAVPLLINQKYRIPKGSKFVLRIGLLIGEKYVDIVPDRSSREYLQPGEKVAGTIPPGLDDLLPQARRVMSSLEETTENLNKVITDASGAIQNMSKVLGDPEIQIRLRQSLANVQSATARLDSAMARIEETAGSVLGTARIVRGTVQIQQANVCVAIENAKAASESLKAFTGELEKLAEKGNIQQDLSAALEAARKSGESLQRSTESLEKLVTSPELQQDVRETVKGAKDAVQEARTVIERLGKVFGKPPIVTREEIPTRRTNVEALYRTADNRFRATLATTVPLKESRFVKLGIYDLGESNEVIIQLGQPIADKMDLRYGLYASKLGLGLDYNLSEKLFSSANLYGSEKTRLDVEAAYRFTDNWGVVVGVDDLLGGNDVVLGVRLSD